MTGIALAHFATLLGVEPDNPLRWGVPAAYLLIGLLGIGWGLLLRQARPQVYAAIGRGARAVTAGLPIPRPRGEAPAPVRPPGREGQS